MAQDVITRTIQGVEAPVVGTWEIDPNHTTIGFVARYIMVTKVRGHFKRFSGAIHVEEKIEDSWAELTIDAASIDTNQPDRDQHLRSPDFLDVERFPTITYRTTKVELTGPTTLKVTGDLTIRDVTKPVVLGVEFVKDKTSREPDADLRDRVEMASFNRGLILLGCGANSIRWSPPLILTKENVDVALKIFDDAIAASV